LLLEKDRSQISSGKNHQLFKREKIRGDPVKTVLSKENYSDRENRGSEREDIWKEQQAVVQQQ